MTGCSKRFFVNVLCLFENTSIITEFQHSELEYARVSVSADFDFGILKPTGSALGFLFVNYCLEQRDRT